jgi:hypothetical protein
MGHIVVALVTMCCLCSAISYWKGGASEPLPTDMLGYEPLPAARHFDQACCQAAMRRSRRRSCCDGLGSLGADHVRPHPKAKNIDNLPLIWCLRTFDNTSGIL